MTTLNAPQDTFDHLDQAVLSGKWHQLQGALRERWGKLTDDDLMQIAGKKDRFLGVLQERYGYSRQEASRLLDEFLHAYNEKKEALTEQESWFGRNSSWLMMAAFAATVAGGLAYYFTRSDSEEIRS